MLIIRFFKLSSCWLWPFTNSLGFMTLKVKNEEANYSRNHMSFFIRYIRGEGERNISHPGKLEIPMIFVESSRKMRQLIAPIIIYIIIISYNYIYHCSYNFISENTRKKYSAVDKQISVQFFTSPPLKNLGIGIE